MTIGDAATCVQVGLWAKDARPPRPARLSLGTHFRLYGLDPLLSRLSAGSFGSELLPNLAQFAHNLVKPSSYYPGQPLAGHCASGFQRMHIRACAPNAEAISRLYGKHDGQPQWLCAPLCAQSLCNDGWYCGKRRVVWQPLRPSGITCPVVRPLCALLPHPLTIHS